MLEFSDNTVLHSFKQRSKSSWRNFLKQISTLNSLVPWLHKTNLLQTNLNATSTNNHIMRTDLETRCLSERNSFCGSNPHHSAWSVIFWPPFEHATGLRSKSVHNHLYTDRQNLSWVEIRSLCNKIYSKYRLNTRMGLWAKIIIDCDKVYFYAADFARRPTLHFTPIIYFSHLL